MPSPALGVFFSDDVLEMVQVGTDGRVARSGIGAVPKGVVVGGVVQKKPELIEAVKQLMKEVRPGRIKSNEEVVVGVPDNHVYLREFAIPKLVDESELTEVVEYQIKSLLPVLPSEVEVDWQVIGKSLDGEIEVLLVAIPREVITSYHQVFRAAGLKVVAIEPAILANLRVVKKDLLQTRNLLFVYVGDSYAEFSLVTNGKPRFCDYLTGTELAKKGTIVDSILDYVQYAASKHLGRGVDGVLLGGTNNQLELVAAHLEKSGVKTWLVEGRVSDAKETGKGKMKTVYGLSLRSTEDEVFNLLPLNFRLTVLENRLFSVWNGVLAVMGVVTLLLVVVGGVWLVRLREESELIRGEIAVIKEELASEESGMLIQEVKRVNMLATRLAILKENTGGEERVLEQLSSVTPTGVVLSSLMYARDPVGEKFIERESDWSVTGMATTRQEVVNFFNSLRTKDAFSEGRLYFGSLDKNLGVSFRIASQVAK